MSKKTTKDSSSDWPPQLDALIAAPAEHIMLLNNDKVRVLDSVVEPGETVPVHTHEHPAVLYVMSWSDFVRYDDRGNILVDSKKAGMNPAIGSAIWTDPLPPHSLKNVGGNTLRVITVEIKG